MCRAALRKRAPSLLAIVRGAPSPSRGGALGATLPSSAPGRRALSRCGRAPPRPPAAIKKPLFGLHRDQIARAQFQLRAREALRRYGRQMALGMRAMHDRFMRHRPFGYERNAAVVRICTGVIRAYLCGQREMPCGPSLTAESVSRFVTISAACADSERWRTFREARLLAAGVFYVMLKMDNLLSDRPLVDWFTRHHCGVQPKRGNPTSKRQVAILTHVDWNVCSPQQTATTGCGCWAEASLWQRCVSSYQVQLDAATMGRCHPAAIAFAAVMVSRYRE